MDSTTIISIERYPNRPDVEGWGVDISRDFRGGVPRELNQETVLTGWNEPIFECQKRRGKVRLTIERKDFPPVFGHSQEPEFLSGLLRDYAFRFSENTMRHWFALILADRIHMVEGWFIDLARGKAPMFLPRMEFRTTDHLRRIVQQGPKSRQERALVAATALGVGLAVFLAARALVRSREQSIR